MNSDLVRLVDSIHRDKGIEKEVIWSAIETALMAVARKHYGEEEEIDVKIDRETGAIEARHSTITIDTEMLGRIGAQAAKQSIIQKIREAERDALYDEFTADKGTIVNGTVTRIEGGMFIVSIGRTEALLPRSEQLPGEVFQVGSRIKAVVLDVRKAGQRVKIILSRVHSDFVRRLFEQEIPEIAENVIEIRSIAREAGFRTKIAVSSIDSRIDCVGACIGMRGSRINGIVGEIKPERIDIIRFNESLQVMIPNALEPAKVEEVQIYNRLGRAIVLVKEDQLSLAIGKRGQNVRLASKLCGIDIDIMTIDELTRVVEKAEEQFSQIPMMPAESIDRFIEEGIFSFSDLSVMEPEHVMEIAAVDEDVAFDIIEFAEDMEEALPSSQTSRSSMLTGTGSNAPPAEAVDQIWGATPNSEGSPTVGEATADPKKLLGADELPAKERKPTISDVFGDSAIEKPSEEKKITPEQLFGDDKS